MYNDRISIGVGLSLSQAAALHRSSHRSKQSRGLEKLISQADHLNGVDPPARRPAVCLCWPVDQQSAEGAFASLPGNKHMRMTHLF